LRDTTSKHVLAYSKLIFCSWKLKGNWASLLITSMENYVNERHFNIWLCMRWNRSFSEYFSSRVLRNLPFLPCQPRLILLRQQGGGRGAPQYFSKCNFDKEKRPEGDEMIRSHAKWNCLIYNFVLGKRQ
jgi:hypothetical protein